MSSAQRPPALEKPGRGPGLGFDKTHPVGVVRRTIVDLIRPIEFQDVLRLRRWCSDTSTGGVKSVCASTAARAG